MSKTKLIQKKEIKTFFSLVQLDNLDPRKIFVVAVIDEKNNFQGYRPLTDMIPENWNLLKSNGSLSLFPIVQGG